MEIAGLPTYFIPSREHFLDLLNNERPVDGIDLSDGIVTLLIRTALSEGGTKHRFETQEKLWPSTLIATSSIEISICADIKWLLSSHRQLLSIPEKSSFRNTPALVGISGHDPYGFIAPVVNFKAELIWMLKLVQDRKHGLIQLFCAVHYFFIYLHPFPNGNGRMARLITLFLVKQQCEKEHMALAALLVAVTRIKKGTLVESLYLEHVFGSGLTNYIETLCGKAKHSIEEINVISDLDPDARCQSLFNLLQTIA